MLTQAELKYYSSLLLKKYRTEKNKFLVEGHKLIFDAIDSDYECECLIASNLFSENQEDILNILSKKVERVEIVKQKDFEKLADTKTPQGIIGVFRKSTQLKNKKAVNKIIALENISDPGNLGTILRNCDWFGFSKIILSDNCSEIYNPKTIRSSAGSIFHLNVNEENDFYHYLSSCKKNGYKILSSDLNGENLYEFSIPEKYVIVFCNEAKGPSDELLSISDYKITISKRGRAESLNVASASAVILSELSR